MQTIFFLAAQDGCFAVRSLRMPACAQRKMGGSTAVPEVPAGAQVQSVPLGCLK